MARTHVVVLLLLAAGAPLVHIGGEAIRAPIAEALLLERPQIVLTASTADIHFDVVRENDEYWLDRDGRRRPLGPEADAVRIAVVLMTRAVDRWRPPVARTASSPPLPAIVVFDLAVEPAITSARERPIARRWRLDAGALIVGWSAPRVWRFGASVAGYYRPTPWLSVGAGTVLVGFCCADTVDNVRSDGWLVGGLLEAGVEHAVGPMTVEGSLGLGVAWERMLSQAIDVFAGPTAPETRVDVGPVARAAAGLRVRPWDRTSLAMTAGLFVRPTPLRVRLPAPYDTDRDDVGRGRLLPFLELSLIVDLF